MVLGALAGYFFVLPQWRHVTDEQVALYLEECEPTLETAILSALEAERQAQRPQLPVAGARASASWTGHRTLRGHRTWPPARSPAAQAVRHRHRRPRSSAALLIFLLGPAYLRQGASALLLVTGDLVEASPYRIDVKPGSTTVPRGSDQVITAKIQGFESDQAELMMRKAVNAPFEHVPMVFNQDTKTFDGMLFDLPGSIDYFVESGGVKFVGLHDARGGSAVCEAARDGIRVPGLHGPGAAQDRKRRRHRRAAGHAGAPAHHAHDEGAHRAASWWTAGRRVALTPEGDVFIGEIHGQQGRLLSLELQGGPENKLVTASPQYTIDVLEDQPPTVSIAKPGRDTTASPIEEFCDRSARRRRLRRAAAAARVLGQRRARSRPRRSSTARTKAAVRRSRRRTRSISKS